MIADNTYALPEQQSPPEAAVVTQPNVLTLPNDIGQALSIAFWVRVLGTGADEPAEVLKFPLSPGTPVWANFKSSGSWYSGRIVSINSDNTYHVAYDDGDTELSVPEECLSDRKHPFGQKSSRGRSSVVVLSQPPLNDDAIDNLPCRLRHPLPDNTPVRVLYHGGPAWLDGIVTTINGDGTYEVLYPHGERYMRIECVAVVF